MISVEKPNFRTPLIERDPVHVLDPYWQRVFNAQADAINIMGRKIEALEALEARIAVLEAGP